MQFKSIEPSELSAPLCIKKIYSFFCECRKYKPRLKAIDSSTANNTINTGSTPATTTQDGDSTKKTTEMISTADDSIDIVVVNDNGE